MARAMFGSCSGIHKLIILIGSLAVLVSIATLSKTYSFRSFLVSDISCAARNFAPHGSTNDRIIKETVEIVIQKIQQKLDQMRVSPNKSSSESKHAVFLADILGLIESVNDYLAVTEPTTFQENSSRPIQHFKEPTEYFLTEEIRKYITIKPNRLGKQNFMGANGTFTSIGHSCFLMKKELEEYMDYDIGDICNDDWKLAQKLMVHGCDPLPRRRCFAKGPQFYTEPLPINESLWTLPDDRNVRWSQYRCKNFTCLAGDSARKGFFKCRDCFNLTDHEFPRWIQPVYQDPRSNLTSDFTITEVLGLKP